MGSGSCHTVVKRLPGMAAPVARDLRAAFWLVRGRRRFYASILEDEVGTLRYRWDPMIMEPANTEARTILKRWLAEVAGSVNCSTIEWEAGRVLILDNWQVLHRRSRATELDEQERVLERVYVR